VERKYSFIQAYKKMKKGKWMCLSNDPDTFYTIEASGFWLGYRGYYHNKPIIGSEMSLRQIESKEWMDYHH
jgi:hypothetical protein